MRLLLILTLSIFSGVFCAYWLWLQEYSWVQIFLGYVVGGTLALTACFAIVYAFSSKGK